MGKYSLSLWAWALNEEDLVEEFVHTSIKHLQAVTDDYEIILVDDGSTDKTWSIMQELDKKIPELVIEKHPRNLRPGWAMHTCLKRTTKEIVFWNTVDTFFDSSTLQEWVDELDSCDMIQGVRTDLVANTPYRQLTHLINKNLIRTLFQINIAEFQNIKFCRADFLREMNFESASMFSNPECSIKAYWMGKTVKEKSMVFQHRPSGKAKGAYPPAVLESIRDIFMYWFKWHILRKMPGPIQRGKIIKLDGSVWPKES